MCKMGKAIFFVSEFFIREIYVIGGLVDHNRLVNMTLDKARRLGLRTKKFRFEGYLELNSRSVLAVNHCKRFFRVFRL